MTASEIPIKLFRLEHGFTFDQALRGPEFVADNMVVGGGDSEEDVDALYLGKLDEFERMKVNVWMDLKGAHVVYVLGKRRSGKTFTLGTLAEGLASRQWIRMCKQDQAILLLDTMNVFLTMPHTVREIFGSDSKEGRELAQWGMEDERLPIRLHYPRGTPAPPEGDPQEIAIRPGDLSAEEWAGLFGADVFSDPIGQLISELYDKVALEGYLETSDARVKAKPNYSIQDMLNCLEHAPDIQRYEPRTIEAVRRRLRALARLAVFSETALEVRQLFLPGQISVILLRDLDQGIRSLLVSILVKKIIEGRSVSDRYERLAAIYSQKGRSLETSKSVESKACHQRAKEFEELAKGGLPRGWILIDEAHNYVPARGIVPSREILRRYVNEGRNLGLSIVVATQQPSGLDPALQRNADILIIHAMSMRDDIQATEGMVNTFIPESVIHDRKERISTRTFEQMVRALGLGYALVANDRMNRIFPVKVRPRFTVHGGKDY